MAKDIYIDTESTLRPTDIAIVRQKVKRSKSTHGSADTQDAREAQVNQMNEKIKSGGLKPLGEV